MRPTSLILGAVVALTIAAPAGARDYSVWGGCGGGAEMLKPSKVDRCTRDTGYALYVDRIGWTAFGDATATGSGAAYTNVCQPSCGFGVWRGAGPATVTLSRPQACGDRRLYTHGVIQLEIAYEGRTTFEESYPCKLVVRRCKGSLRNGALRGIAQRAGTCAKAKAVVRRWAKAAGYQSRRYTRASVRIGPYRCRRFALGRHQLLVTCRAPGRRFVRFRGVRS
jgi:hypothetical protein